MGTTLLEPTPAGANTHAAARTSAAPRTVCHLIAGNFVGGPEKQILEHCRRLDPGRWRAVVGSFREGRDRVPVLEAARERALPVFAIDTRLPWSPGAAWQLRAQVRRHGVDLLVTHGYKPNAVGCLMRRWTRIPQIAYVRGYTAETWRVRRYEDLDRFLLRYGLPRVLCVSESTRRRLAELGVNASKIHTVYNAVDPPAAVTPAPLRAEFRIPPEAPLLVDAGRLSAEKGHRFLIEAMARLRQTPAPQLVLLGEGREEGRLRGLARALDVAERVHLAGFRGDPLSALLAADLVVNPSLTEGMPNVVLEAQSLEVPVVATDVGGVAEIIEPGRTGWLVAPGSAEALATGIRQALADPARTRRMAAAGRARVAERFSFAVQAERLMAIYDDALGR